MLAIDASALLLGLTDESADGRAVRTRLADEDLLAPDLIDLEFASAIRRFVRSGSMSARRAHNTLQDLADLSLTRISHRQLVSRCWELRENLSIYDGAYVAAAEASQAVLLTADRRMSRAPGPRCEIEVI